MKQWLFRNYPRQTIKAVLGLMVVRDTAQGLLDNILGKERIGK